MTYIKINETMYPATISGSLKDRLWDDRESKTITLAMDYATATALFVDGLAWSILMDVETVQEDGTVEVVQTEYDNSEYCVAGAITDHRNGTLSVKMGKKTETETLQAQLAEAMSADELENAYEEGVQSL